MSFSTHFQHTETTYLPLPPLQSGESDEETTIRGLKTAIGIVQNHDFMISVNPLVTKFERIPASSDQAVNVEKLAVDFNVELEDDDGQQRVNGGDDWSHYEIHDQVPVIFGYKKDMLYHTAMRNTSTGMESLTDPGNSVTIHGKFGVTRNKDDASTLILTERATTYCNLALGWYIKSTVGSSHANIHKSIKARFVEEMRK